MKRFIQGECRGQTTLLPESLDDYVADTNPVRVVDVFVDELDLGRLNFDGIVPAETGRPAYHPSVLLKLYIYGYLNRIQSSRRLEREAQRNVELMWLTGRLTPDFKTIANFRKDNGKAIRGVCRQFVVLCQQLGLFAEALVAIDGSKFKAVNNRDRNFTSAKLKRRMEEIESSISRYLSALDTADRQEPAVAQVKTALRYLTELENIGLDLDLQRVRASARLEQARLHWMHGDLFLSERIVREVEAMPIWDEIKGYALPAQDIETPATMRWRLAISNGQADKVIDNLKQAIRQAQNDLRMRRCLKLKLLLAMAYQAQDKQQNALLMLTEALRLASDEGFVRSFLDEGSTLHPLLRLWRARHQRMALPVNVSDSFVDQLLAEIGEPMAQPLVPTPANHETPPLDPLSKRELQVLHYIAEGLRNREIADKIFLSETTVKAHLRRIHSKLDAHSRTQAVAIARKHGWI